MGEKGSGLVRNVDRSGRGVVARLESAAVTARPSLHVDAIGSGTIGNDARVMDARPIVPFSIAWATHSDRRISR